MMKVTLIIPTLNEIEGVKAIMPRIQKEWVDEILIVDGNSTDGTREYLKEHGYNVIIQKDKGVLAAWWEGFEASEGDAIILFSPDNNSIPEVIPRLVSKAKEGYDMVIASRYKEHARSYDDNLISAIGNFVFTKLINFLFNADYTDTLVMYRIFKRELLTTLKLDKDKNSVFEVLLSIRCAKRKLKVTEIPADEPARIDGKDSRVHSGFFGRLRGGIWISKVIIKELFAGN